MLGQNIARLDYQRPEAVNYLHYLRKLDLNGLVVPSWDRDLTDSGRKVVGDAFGDNLDIGQIVGIVKTLRQGNTDLSELDAFLFEAFDIIYVMSSDAQKSNIDVRECRMLMPRKGTYLLAGISVLRKATEAGVLTVNPPGSPTDQCYVKYH